MLRDLVDYAAQVANGLLVPTVSRATRGATSGRAERFYVRMLDMEAKGSTKVADFQNFAKSFAFGDYATLMASTTANAASLAGAADLKGRMLDGEGFAKTQLRQVLFAVWKTMEKRRPQARRDDAADRIRRRLLAAPPEADRARRLRRAKTKRTRPEESAAADELAEALKLDRV